MVVSMHSADGRDGCSFRDSSYCCHKPLAFCHNKNLMALCMDGRCVQGKCKHWTLYHYESTEKKSNCSGEVISDSMSKRRDDCKICKLVTFFSWLSRWIFFFFKRSEILSRIDAFLQSWASEIPSHVRGSEETRLVAADSLMIAWHNACSSLGERGTVQLICLHVLCS